MWCENVCVKGFLCGCGWCLLVVFVDVGVGGRCGWCLWVV